MKQDIEREFILLLFTLCDTERPNVTKLSPILMKLFNNTLEIIANRQNAEIYLPSFQQNLFLLPWDEFDILSSSERVNKKIEIILNYYVQEASNQKISFKKRNLNYSYYHAWTCVYRFIADYQHLMPYFQHLSCLIRDIYELEKHVYEKYNSNNPVYNSTKKLCKKLRENIKTFCELIIDQNNKKINKATLTSALAPLQKSFSDTYREVAPILSDHRLGIIKTIFCGIGFGIATLCTLGGALAMKHHYNCKHYGQREFSLWTLFSHETKSQIKAKQLQLTHDQFFTESQQSLACMNTLS